MAPADADATLALIVEAVDDPSAKGIAAAVGRLVNGGLLQAGQRLPTVRRTASGLQVSPTTVSHAWRSLARAGLVRAHRRSGTFVRPGGHSSPARRMLRVFENPGSVGLDLSTGIPDPALLPDLGPALRRAGQRRFAHHYADHPVLPALEEILRERWPFPPQRMTVLSGALDALDRIVGLAVGFGDRVLVENPCFPPMLDMLEQRGAEPVPVDLDEHGPDPASVRAGLESAPSVFLLQSRAQNPSGVSLTPERASQLARTLRKTSVLVVEDDHAGDISSVPLASIGAHLPEQVVHIRSFAKSHGPDLRLAAVGGRASLVDAVDQRRLIGPGWSSLLLQAVLADLLTDPASTAAIEEARRVYADRRRRIGSLLSQRGVSADGGDGINLWVEVAHEQSALLVLAAAGIGAAPGSPFEARSLATDHLRVTVGLVGDPDLVRVADALAAAAVSVGRWVGGGPRPLASYR